MSPKLRWAWPAAFAAAVGITISAAAQTFTGRTVPVPRVKSGTNVTPELFVPHAMTGKPNGQAPVSAPSVSLEPPSRLAPVPGSQPIVPAPLARPAEPEVETVKTEPPAERSEPPPRAAEAVPEKETARRPVPPVKPRAARRTPPPAAKARKERAPVREARSQRGAPANSRAGKTAGGDASSRAQRPAHKKPPARPPVLPSAGATAEQIVAAFRSLEPDEQQRVMRRCKTLLASSKEAEANELRVCRAISASS